MKKRALMILMTVLLSFTSVVSPVCPALASDGTDAQEEAGDHDR